MQLVEKSINPLMSQDGKVLTGLFAELGTLNQNGRRYPDSIYETAYEELVPKIKERRLLGELDHPIDYDEVRLSNVSHAIVDCSILEDDDGIKKVYGSVELLDTPAGLIAQALVKAGIPLGISSRGLGATKQVRDGVEVTSLKLITYDLVAEPSFANAILSPEKSGELSDSLHYIESKLPLNESVETTSVRTMISNIRESLLNRETASTVEVDIDKVELESLRKLVESTQKTIKSDTQTMIASRQEVKKLRQELKESENRNKDLLKNMMKIQEAYNKLKETTLPKDSVSELEENLVSVKKQLAVEKRGMSYDQVSEILEGAITDSEIESRLDSLSSVSKRRKQSRIVIENKSQTETGSRVNEDRKLTGLASIVARV